MRLFFKDMCVIIYYDFNMNICQSLDSKYCYQDDIYNS